MKVAIVHDFLKEYGGAERVVEALHEMYPDAPIYTAFVDYEGLGPHVERVASWNIKTTWLQELPLISKLYSPLRFLAPLAFRSLNLSEYDVIISSSNAYYAKGVLKGRADQVHICYCHTPPRSLYGYATAMDWKKNPIVRLYGTIINHFLRMYDFKAAQAPARSATHSVAGGVDYFIANSEEVKRRIKKFYRRDSVVIYPPVSSMSSRPSSDVVSGRVEGFRTSKSSVRDSSTSLGMTKGKFYLYVGKLAYAKHVDLAILAANKLKIPLKIVGKGGSEEELRRIPGRTVEFLGEVSDEALHALYAQAKALIFPAEDEDFGIVPVEAMAHGLPVIAHRSGGVVESVIHKKTGVFFDELTVDSLVSAIKSFGRLGINKEDCVRQAEKFSKERFIVEIEKFVKEHVHSVQ